jgi:hypothetical protein
VQKLPASNVAGIPDWLLVGEPHGAQLFEAKLALPRGKFAFDPLRQLTGAQRFVLGQIYRRWKPAANILVLDETGYLELPYTTRRVLRRVFDQEKQRYV